MKRYFIRFIATVLVPITISADPALASGLASLFQNSPSQSTQHASTSFFYETQAVTPPLDGGFKGDQKAFWLRNQGGKLLSEADLARRESLITEAIAYYRQTIDALIASEMSLDLSTLLALGRLKDLLQQAWTNHQEAKLGITPDSRSGRFKPPLGISRPRKLFATLLIATGMLFGQAPASKTPEATRTEMTKGKRQAADPAAQKTLNKVAAENEVIATYSTDKEFQKAWNLQLPLEGIENLNNLLALVIDNHGASEWMASRAAVEHWFAVASSNKTRTLMPDNHLAPRLYLGPEGFTFKDMVFYPNFTTEGRRFKVESLNSGKGSFWRRAIEIAGNFALGGGIHIQSNTVVQKSVQNMLVAGLLARQADLPLEQGEQDRYRQAIKAGYQLIQQDLKIRITEIKKRIAEKQLAHRREGAEIANDDAARLKTSQLEIGTLGQRILDLTALEGNRTQFQRELLRFATWDDDQLNEATKRRWDVIPPALHEDWPLVQECLEIRFPGEPARALPILPANEDLYQTLSSILDHTWKVNSYSGLILVSGEKTNAEQPIKISRLMSEWKDWDSLPFKDLKERLAPSPLHRQLQGDNDILDATIESLKIDKKPSWQFGIMLALGIPPFVRPTGQLNIPEETAQAEHFIREAKIRKGVNVDRIRQEDQRVMDEEFITPKLAQAKALREARVIAAQITTLRMSMQTELLLSQKSRAAFVPFATDMTEKMLALYGKLLEAQEANDEAHLAMEGRERVHRAIGEHIDEVLDVIRLTMPAPDVPRQQVSPEDDSSGKPADRSAKPEGKRSKWFGVFGGGKVKKSSMLYGRPTWIRLSVTALMGAMPRVAAGMGSGIPEKIKHVAFEGPHPWILVGTVGLILFGLLGLFLGWRWIARQLPYRISDRVDRSRLWFSGSVLIGSGGWLFGKGYIQKWLRSTPAPDEPTSFVPLQGQAVGMEVPERPVYLPVPEGEAGEIENDVLQAVKALIPAKTAQRDRRKSVDESRFVKIPQDQLVVAWHAPSVDSKLVADLRAMNDFLISNKVGPHVDQGLLDYLDTERPNHPFHNALVKIKTHGLEGSKEEQLRRTITLFNLLKNEIDDLRLSYSDRGPSLGEQTLQHQMPRLVARVNELLEARKLRDLEATQSFRIRTDAGFPSKNDKVDNHHPITLFRQIRTDHSVQEFTLHQDKLWTISRYRKEPNTFVRLGIRDAQTNQPTHIDVPLSAIKDQTEPIKNQRRLLSEWNTNLVFGAKQYQNRRVQMLIQWPAGFELDHSEPITFQAVIRKTDGKHGPREEILDEKIPNEALFGVVHVRPSGTADRKYDDEEQALSRELDLLRNLHQDIEHALLKLKNDWDYFNGDSETLDIRNEVQRQMKVLNDQQRNLDASIQELEARRNALRESGTAASDINHVRGDKVSTLIYPYEDPLGYDLYPLPRRSPIRFETNDLNHEKLARVEGSATLVLRVDVRHLSHLETLGNQPIPVLLPDGSKAMFRKGLRTAPLEPNHGLDVTELELECPNFPLSRLQNLIPQEHNAASLVVVQVLWPETSSPAPAKEEKIPKIKMDGKIGALILGAMPETVAQGWSRRSLLGLSWLSNIPELKERPNETTSSSWPRLRRFIWSMTRLLIVYLVIQAPLWGAADLWTTIKSSGLEGLYCAGVVLALVSMGRATANYSQKIQRRITRGLYARNLTPGTASEVTFQTPGVPSDENVSPFAGLARGRLNPWQTHLYRWWRMSFLNRMRGESRGFGRGQDDIITSVRRAVSRIERSEDLRELARLLGAAQLGDTESTPDLQNAILRAIDEGNSSVTGLRHLKFVVDQPGPWNFPISEQVNIRGEPRFQYVAAERLGNTVYIYAPRYWERLVNERGHETALLMVVTHLLTCPTSSSPTVSNDEIGERTAVHWLRDDFETAFANLSSRIDPPTLFETVRTGLDELINELVSQDQAALARGDRNEILEQLRGITPAPVVDEAMLTEVIHLTKDTVEEDEIEHDLNWHGHQDDRFLTFLQKRVFIWNLWPGHRIRLARRKVFQRLFYRDNIGWFSAFFLNARYVIKKWQSKVEEKTRHFGVVTALIFILWTVAKLDPNFLVTLKENLQFATPLIQMYQNTEGGWSSQLIYWLLMGGFVTTNLKGIGEGAWTIPFGLLSFPTWVIVKVGGLERSFYEKTNVRLFGTGSDLHESQRSNVLERIHQRNPLGRTDPQYIRFYELWNRIGRQVTGSVFKELENEPREANGYPGTLSRLVTRALYDYDAVASRSNESILRDHSLHLPSDEDLLRILRLQGIDTDGVGVEELDRLLENARVYTALLEMVKQPFAGLLALMMHNLTGLAEMPPELAGLYQQALEALQDRTNTWATEVFDGNREFERILQVFIVASTVIDLLPQGEFARAKLRLVRERLRPILSRSTFSGEAHFEAQALEAIFGPPDSLPDIDPARRERLANPVMASNWILAWLRRLDKMDRNLILELQKDLGIQPAPLKTVLTKYFLRDSQGHLITSAADFLNGHILGKMLRRPVETYTENHPLLGRRPGFFDAALLLNIREAIRFLRMIAKSTTEDIVVFGRSAGLSPHLKKLKSRLKSSRIEREWSKRIIVLDLTVPEQMAEFQRRLRNAIAGNGQARPFLVSSVELENLLMTLEANGVDRVIDPSPYFDYLAYLALLHTLEPVKLEAIAPQVALLDRFLASIQVGFGIMETWNPAILGTLPPQALNAMLVLLHSVKVPEEVLESFRRLVSNRRSVNPLVEKEAA